MSKIISAWALSLLSLALSCSLLHGQDISDSMQTTDLDPSTNISVAPAPSWQRIGNTGLATQNWWIQFDKTGKMYVSSNNPPAGGVSRSTDKGYHWTVINTGFTCHLHRGMGMAPDGTIFVGNDYCNNYNQGLNHFYWLDNVSGSGTKWTAVSTPSSNNGGQINDSVIANDGKTIVRIAGSGFPRITREPGLWRPEHPREWPKALRPISNPTARSMRDSPTAVSSIPRTRAITGPGWGIPRATSPMVTSGQWRQLRLAPTPAILIVAAGNAGATIKTGTGFWCYGPAAAPNGPWHFCGNNQYAGQMAIDATGIIINKAKTRAIALYYGDRGLKPVYSDDGVNWKACNSGLPLDPSTTLGGANAQGMQIDPVTSYVYIVLKNGNIYRTTQPQ